MSAPEKPPVVTEEEYLARAEASQEKLEFVDGVMYAMAGAHPDHNTIAQNVGRAFAVAADARGCRDFSSDQRIKASEYGDYVYPDLVYSCGQPEFEGISLVNPTLVVEVLSPSTELYDRKTKMSLYRAMPSVEEIVLIASDEPLVERHRRHGELWTYEVARGLEASIPVLGQPVLLADVYRFILFPTGAALSPNEE